MDIPGIHFYRYSFCRSSLNGLDSCCFPPTRRVTQDAERRYEKSPLGRGPGHPFRHTFLITVHAPSAYLSAGTMFEVKTDGIEIKRGEWLQGFSSLITRGDQRSPWQRRRVETSRQTKVNVMLSMCVGGASCSRQPAAGSDPGTPLLMQWPRRRRVQDSFETNCTPSKSTMKAGKMTRQKSFGGRVRLALGPYVDGSRVALSAHVEQ
jgi:hypothetical protein